MGRNVSGDPKTSDLRLKVGSEFESKMVEAKKGTAFEYMTVPEFARHLLYVGLRAQAAKEGLFEKVFHYGQQFAASQVLSEEEPRANAI